MKCHLEVWTPKRHALGQVTYPSKKAAGEWSARVKRHFETVGEIPVTVRINRGSAPRKDG